MYQTKCAFLSRSEMQCEPQSKTHPRSDTVHYLWRVSPISALGPCGNSVLESNNAFLKTFLRSRDFLIPGVHRSKAETRHATLTPSSQQTSLFGAFLSLNCFVLAVSNHYLYKIFRTCLNPALHNGISTSLFLMETLVLMRFLLL